MNMSEALHRELAGSGVESASYNSYGKPAKAEASPTKSPPYQENEAIEIFRALSVARKPVAVRSETSTKPGKTEGAEQTSDRYELRGAEGPFGEISAEGSGSQSSMQASQDTSSGQPEHQSSAQGFQMEIKVPVLQIDDDDGSDTEDEIEVIEVLRKKAEKDQESEKYDAEERYRSKQYQRLSKLIERKPKHQTAMFDCLFSLSFCLVNRRKWEEAKDMLMLINESELNKVQEDGREYLLVLVYIALKDINAAMAMSAKLTKARRKAYGKTHPQYQEALALKVRTMSLNGDIEEAEAFLAILPEKYHAVAGKGLDQQTKRLSNSSKLELVDRPVSPPTDTKSMPQSNWFQDSQMQEIDDDSFSKLATDFAQCGDVKKMRKLIEQERDETSRLYTANKAGKLLMLATEGGHIRMVHYLVDAGCDLTKCDSYGNTAFLRACSFGHKRIVQYLQSKDPERFDNIRRAKGLIEAARNDHLGVVKFLLSEGWLPINITYKDSMGRNALHYAVERDSVQIVTALLNFANDKLLLKATANSEDSDGCRPYDLAKTETIKNAFRSHLGARYS